MYFYCHLRIIIDGNIYGKPNVCFYFVINVYKLVKKQIKLLVKEKFLNLSYPNLTYPLPLALPGALVPYPSPARGLSQKQTYR